jgi:hypothetical protein
MTRRDVLLTFPNCEPGVFWYTSLRAAGQSSRVYAMHFEEYITLFNGSEFILRVPADEIGAKKSTKKRNKNDDSRARMEALMDPEIAARALHSTGLDTRARSYKKQ